MFTKTGPKRLERKFAQVLRRSTSPARDVTHRPRAKSWDGLKRLLNTAPRVGACLTLCLLMTACSSLGKVNNAPFLVASLEAAKTPKPTQCDRTPPPTDYPEPRGVHLRSGTDIAEQGVAYGDAYERGRDFYKDREDKHDLFWSACDKEYEAAVERWEANEAARLAAIEAARKLLE